mmetsp:Transcript_16324/g.51088  ORF Transcript_16324/g.51088 Transcript_16324/m.51088 type:complete len:112 (-) Transcript_16324:86-421(-)
MPSSSSSKKKKSPSGISKSKQTTTVVETEEIDGSGSNGLRLIDFSLLDTLTLKRYALTFKLRTSPSYRKKEYVSVISKHFASLQVGEIDAIEMFLERLRTDASQLTAGPVE